MSRPINITSAVTFIPSSSGIAGTYGFTTSTNANSAITNAYTSADSTTSARLTVATTASGRKYEAYFYYDMSALTDIPSNATINSVSGRVKYNVSSTQTSRISAVTIQLYTNTTPKGSATTARTTSATVYTMTAGTWTLSELQNARLYVSAVRGTNTSNSAYLYLYGSDLTVNYSVNGTEYEVSFNNQSSDATTDPSTTQYVYQGGSQEIKIYIDNTDDYVVKDNGTNVNSSLIEHEETNNVSEVVTAPGASYGFQLDTSDGYYKSQNKGVNYSAAVCRLNITAETQCTLTLNFVNYAEATYDYGIIGRLDTTLVTTSANTNSATTWMWAGSATTNNTQVEKTTAVTIPTGYHYIDIKFRKDDATSSNNDAFWFKYGLEPGNEQH
ncbi:MAG: hypothetical protein II630_02630, partial [Bacteroidales bacterium]|nr:hypothetical protein [Bacteroidales bacterium]